MTLKSDVWQNPLQYCKVISLQLIKINGKKKNTSEIIKKKTDVLKTWLIHILSNILKNENVSISKTIPSFFVQASYLNRKHY